MDKVRFSARRAHLEAGTILVVSPEVNDQPLWLTLSIAESPDGVPRPGAVCASLAVADDGRVQSHYLGDPATLWFGEASGIPLQHGETVIMGCTCGNSECAPLIALVETSSNQVVWRDFRRHGQACPARVGPFTFDRDAYLRALDLASAGSAD